MNENLNYQMKMDQILKKLQQQKAESGDLPTLLLHACCAPCSSYVLEYLSAYFRITIFYYNPNISEEKEYKKRVLEVKRLIEEMPLENPVTFMEGNYDTGEFNHAIEGKEHLGEGSVRCYSCYELRLSETARIAKEKGYDFFTTTLSISPYKNVKWLNEIGEQLEKEYDISYLFSDFKKKNGYKRSIELSTKYHLYRQDFCGCDYSRKEEMARKMKKGLPKE